MYFFFIQRQSFFLIVADVETNESKYLSEVQVLKTCCDSLRSTLRITEEAANETSLECNRQNETIIKHEDDKERLTIEHTRLLNELNESLTNLEHLKHNEVEWQKEIASLLADKHKAGQLRDKHQQLKRKYGEANNEIRKMKDSVMEMQEKLRKSYAKDKSSKDSEVAGLKKRMRFLNQRVNQMAASASGGNQSMQEPGI